MEQEKTVTGKISIHAPAAKVWDALTKPEWTRQYMFGCDVISDWKPGSPVTWKGVFNGKEMVAVKGKVVRIDPGKSLQYTVIDPNSSIPDIPENYLTVTYTLSEEGDHTTVTISQGDYSKVADGEKRYQESVGGWDMILAKIRELVER